MNPPEITLHQAIQFHIADNFRLESAALLGHAHEVLGSGQALKRDYVIQDRNDLNSGLGAFSADGDSLLSLQRNLQNVRFIRYSSSGIVEPVDHVSCTTNQLAGKTIVFWLTELPRHPFAGL